MSSLTNINNNSSVVNVGRTTPVSPGPQPASQSIPVVIASDQDPIPVIEQQKVQSEVALSMLGIPRGEVALGIFSDVNTYDVNPTEWSKLPLEYTTGHGVKHLPNEAGAIVQAPKNEYAVLSSKRFFRYQPGRVSAATFGVKSSKSDTPDYLLQEYDRNPSIRKFGIFDNFDGYYWESRGDSFGDNFGVVRRTQSLLFDNPVTFGTGNNFDDYRIVGKPSDSQTEISFVEPRAAGILLENKFSIAENAFDAAVARGGAIQTYLEGLSDEHKVKCLRDMDFALDAYILDLQWGGDGHSIANATTYRTAILNNAASEQAVHEELRDEIINILNVNDVTDLDSKITTLASYTIDAVGGNTIDPSTADYANRSKIETIFSIYKRYIGYLVSSMYDSYSDILTDETVSQIKFKCARDVAYIMDGYARDLANGGNAATVYNAKNYYFQLEGGSLQVFSQRIGSNPAEIQAHELVKTFVSKSGLIGPGDEPANNTTDWNFSNVNILLQDFESIFSLFDLSSYTDRFNDLSDIIINNFTTPYSGKTDYGTASQYGDLVVLRDGLIHIHAAVYDPSLLKDPENVRVRIIEADNQLEVASGEFVKDQHVRFAGDSLVGLTDGKIYGVKEVFGPKSNIITLYDPTDSTKEVIALTAQVTANYIQPNVPFICPETYYLGAQTSNSLPYHGMFPFLYSDGILPVEDMATATYSGYIDTALDLTDLDSLAEMKKQIDQVNYAYNNWIKQNVDPMFYSVYEYRVPRSRFSTDKLDGASGRVVYSDRASGREADGTLTTVRPGQPVLTSSGEQLETVSVWDLDISKVTMLKVEFSWYGAVGAIFLAYVPVGNGEARWVRVHHMRASNQLKISSLGNATLPISYLTYGGGDVNSLGIENTNQSAYEGGFSDYIVKYGASYYIDGGDRGTVRLYSHTNNLPNLSYGDRFDIPGIVTLGTDSIYGSYFSTTDNLGIITSDVDSITYFMNAKVIAGGIDQNVTVKWVEIDGSNYRFYLDRDITATSNISMLVDRPSMLFGLKAKENIYNDVGVAIRNRVQVYPTKMSTANFGSTPLKLNIVKTPLFQSNAITSGSIQLNTNYIIATEKTPMDVSNDAYLSRDGEYVYGWFRGTIGLVIKSIFGKLYRRGGDYFFESKEISSDPIELFSASNFLKDGRFGFDGSLLTAGSNSEIVFQKERLSSIYISAVSQAMIPDTGGVVTSFYLNPGSEQFDLSSYFDYNKDYLSFPLTNEVESFYFTTSYAGAFDINSTIQANMGITWEEQ